MKNIAIKISLLAIALLISIPTLVMAAGPGFGSGVDDGCDVPLDGGISLLAIAGIGYAAKKAVDNKQKKKKSEVAE